MRPKASEADVRNSLDELGPPEDIVAAARPATCPDKARSPLGRPTAPWAGLLGGEDGDLSKGMLAENPDDVASGAANVVKQIKNLRLFEVSPVAVNTFPTDHASEHAAILQIAERGDARCSISTHFSHGGRGAVELAEAVAEAADEPRRFRLLYPDEASLRDKIETIATKVYGADGVAYTAAAARQIDTYEKAGFGRLPICMA